MSLLPVHTYAFASIFRLKELVPLFAPAEVTLQKDALVVQWSASSWALAFDFGAVVFIGVSLEQRMDVIDKLTQAQEEGEHPPLTEDFLLEVRPGSAWEVQFDRVVVPHVSLPVLEIVALLLAQSTAMDYYDEDLQDISKRLEHITKGLQHQGRIPYRVKDLLRFIGTCIATKNDILGTLALFDKPESTWDDPALYTLYEELRLELEIQDRYRVFESKLRMMQETLSLLVDLSQTRSSWRLELTVVILILVEILISVWQLVR